MRYDWNLPLFLGDSEYEFILPTEKFVSFDVDVEKVCCVNEKFVSVISMKKYLPKDCFNFEMENTIVSTFCGNYFIDSFGVVWELNPEDITIPPVKISLDDFPEIICIGCCGDYTYFVGKDKTVWMGRYHSFDFGGPLSSNFTVEKIPYIDDALYIYTHESFRRKFIFILCENGKILLNVGKWQWKNRFFEFCPFSNVISISFSADHICFLLSNWKVYQSSIITFFSIIGRSDLTTNDLPNNVQRIDNFSWFISNDGFCNGNTYFTTCKVTNTDGEEIGEDPLSFFIDYYPFSNDRLLCWTRSGEIGITTFEKETGLTFQDFGFENLLPIFCSRKKSANK